MSSTCNNSSTFPLLDNGRYGSYDPKSGPIYDYLPFVASFTVVVSSLEAVVGNLLIMATIWCINNTPFGSSLALSFDSL